MKKGFLTGLFLFGIFFGAGNLIFPPTLGLLSGDQFWPAILGFIVSGVGIAVITLIVGTFNAGGYRAEMDQKFSPLVSIGYLTLLYLTIGPFFAIPRTATTSFAIGLPDAVQNAPLWLFIFTAIYFIAAYIIAMNPSKIINRIGKILTPIFALMILLIIILGSIKFADQPVMQAMDVYSSGNALAAGFIEGYNTLDALAAIAFCLIALDTLKKFGFQSKKEYIYTVGIVGFVTAIGFSVLYIGLAWLGNKFPITAEVLANPAIHKGAYILKETSFQIFGSMGQIFLASMVILTCFTTTVGLIVATAEFFASTYTKYSYIFYVRLFSLIGFTAANAGLNTIIKFSIPILLLLYPITITIVTIVILHKFLPLSRIGMKVTLGMVTIFALLTMISSIAHIEALNQVLSSLPLHNYSLSWILPAVFGLLLMVGLPDKEKVLPLENFWSQE